MQTYFCWHYFSEMETYAAMKPCFLNCNKNCHLKIGQDITDLKCLFWGGVFWFGVVFFFL